MATSTEEITPDVVLAAYTIMDMANNQSKKQSPKRDYIGDEVASTPLLQVSQTHQSMKRKREKKKQDSTIKRKRVYKKQDETSKSEKEDDSEETLRCMLDYQDKTPNYPPEKIFIHDPDAVGYCSKPIWKQLTGSDVKKDQCRLMLGREQVTKMMLDVLKATLELGTEGIKVSVYGPDGEIHDLMFKKWKLNSVLASPAWKKFVKTYNLNKYCDFLTIWMFIHKRTHQICFAIDSTNYPVHKKLSNRIKTAAFKNPN